MTIIIKYNMVESLSDFPFRKLQCDKLLTLEVMMFVDHQEVKQFMFNLNKKARSYIQTNIVTVQNGFINEGLVTFKVTKMNFKEICLLEELYL